MEQNTEKPVSLRNGATVLFKGKGALGRILIGRDPASGEPMTWHLSGRWRWDDIDHELDIVDGFIPDKA